MHCSICSICTTNDDCFLCGKSIDHKEGFINWFGIPGFSLDLHKNCAAELMVHLGSDLLKLKIERAKRDEIQIF